MLKRIGTILTSIILLSSCTESVSEQLKQNSSAAPTSLTTTTTNSFSVVNAMGENFSHYMHDARSISGDCKVSGNDLEAINYDSEDPSIAKDCFLEVEELDLYYQGASLNVKADAGMCEYMVFKPFYFWQYQAGKTERTVYFIECDDVCATDADSAAQCGKYYYTNSGPQPNPPITNFSQEASFDDIQQLCHFDHTQKDDLEDESPPNCDEGSVNVITVSFSTDGNDPAECVHAAGTISGSEETECGGEMTACLAGPAKELVTGFPESTGMLIYNEDLSAIDETYEVAAPFDQGYKTNMYAANYMRSCSDTNSSNDKGPISFHRTATFLGHNIESFAKILDTDTTDDQGYFARPIIYEQKESSAPNNKYELYSSNPFRGRYYNGKPYYGFYCLDRAFDIKAQIRVFIRDWDRSFSKTYSFLSNTSDIGNGSFLRYMDTQFSIDTPPDDYDNDIPFNNVYDWDDFLQSKYLKNWDASTGLKGGVKLYDKSSNEHGIEDDIPTVNDESDEKIINSGCTDMSSPYFEYNFPRAGL